MKYMFLLASILCAAACSLLGVILATGKIPFRQEAAAAVSAPDVQMVGETLTVFPAEANIVDELREALILERENYEKKLVDLAGREKAVKEREEIVASLKAELMTLQAKLDDQIVEMVESETANFRRLAAVYSKMDPASSSKILTEMTEERAAKILSLMGERQAGAIMDDSVAKGDDGIKTADRWTDAIRRMKQTAKREE